MSKIPKYYEPDISEFHIGFEYEEYKKEKWTKLIAPPTNFPYIWESQIFNTSQSLSKITQKLKTHIRVKCLDEEDIEELGWIQHAVYNHIWYIEAERAIFYLSFTSDYRYEIDNDRDGEKCFLGNIKNKSELRKLMEMIDIKVRKEDIK